jgi:hypothetical protein
LFYLNPTHSANLLISQRLEALDDHLGLAMLAAFDPLRRESEATGIGAPMQVKF